MVLIVYESRWVYPEIQAYFSQTGNLTGQQLATRSRVYLQDAQVELLNDQPEQAAYEAAMLDIAAANTAAISSPTSPIGRCVVMNVGKT